MGSPRDPILTSRLFSAESRSRDRTNRAGALAYPFVLQGGGAPLQRLQIDAALEEAGGERDAETGFFFFFSETGA